MKKKIIISSFDSIGNTTYDGGGAQSIHNLSKKLVGHYDIKVVAGKFGKIRNQLIDGVHYEYIGSKIFPLFDQGIFHIASLIYAVTHKCDLWIESFTPPAVTGLIPLFSKFPVIGLAHMLPGADMERKYYLPFTLIERISLKFYKAIIVTTKQFAKKIKKLSKRTRVTIIPNGIEDIHTSKALRKNIVYIGRIEVNQKGLDLLIKAYSTNPELKKYPLVIGGTGSKKEITMLQKTIADISNIKYLGKVASRDKSKLFSSAAMVVVPSRYETFSLVSAECLSSATPLVTFDIDGLKWIPESSRWVAKRMDCQSLADQMVNVIRNPKLAKKKADSAKVVVKNMSWDRIALEYDNLIKDTLHE